MEKCNNFFNGKHFKNEMCLKSYARKENFRITQMLIRLSKIALITVMMLIASTMTADAQRNTFADSYLKLRQPKEEKEILFQKLNRKDIRKLLAEKPVGQTEKEQLEYLRMKAMLKDVEQICLVLDMEEDGLISSSQFRDLFTPYDEMISAKMENMWMLVSGAFAKKGKIKELIVLMSDVEDEALIFATILFKKPVMLKDYMENPEDISQLLSVNSPDEENDNALIKIKFNKSNSINFSPTIESIEPLSTIESIPTTKSIPIGGLLDLTSQFTLDVVQIDGKYGVRGSPWNKEYLIEPSLEIAPVIYGSNPGNTYIMVFDHNYCILHDKFGFTIAHGDKLSPVYVLENEEEVAAFIIRDGSGYSLYDCPETYTLIPQGNSLRPHIKRRILDCQSIVQTDDGRLECVNADGSIEFIPIRKQI